MEEQELRVNAGKMKTMICSTGLDFLQSVGEFPCAVCRTGIFCNDCKHFVPRKGSGLKRLTKDPDYRCSRCQGTARPLDGSLQRRTRQAGGDSFLLLRRRHALNSWWLLARLGIEDLDLKKRRLRWYWHVERSNGAVKAAFDLQVDGKRGPQRWHWSSWHRGIAESGRSRLMTLMTDIPGDLVWDLPCVQQASYLEGVLLMWMLPAYLHVNKKSDDDDTGTWTP